MRSLIFIATLLAAAVSGYGWWTVVGDSWLLPSIAGAFWGWIGCVIANLGRPVHVTEWPNIRGPRTTADVVSSTHPARSFKR